MITRLQVRGFKSLLDVDVTLGPLTVFVGANGSGKTSVLEAIRFLRDAVLHPGPGAHNPPLYRIRLERLLSRQGVEPIVAAASLLTKGGVLDLRGDFLPRSYELSLVQADQSHRKNVTLERPSRDELPSSIKTAAHGIEMFRLDAEAMAKSTYSDETEPVLAFNGENLAAVLDALQGTARERFDEIERRMQEFVPWLKRLRVKRARTPMRGRRKEQPPSLVIGHQVAFDFDHAPDISAEDASEGTMLLLGLLTIIESKPPGDMTIMLDDLDRALHPKAQRELVGYLHELVRSRPGLQIIATTHSPYLVEHLAYEEVRAITQRPDGTSVVASLADHPQAERWREEMSAGEFWGSVGESWVAASGK